MHKKSSSYIFIFVVLFTATMLSGCPVKMKNIPPTTTPEDPRLSSDAENIETVEVVEPEVIASENQLSPEAEGTIESESLYLSDKESTESEVDALENFSLQDILFEYDSSALSQQNRNSLSAIADWMSEHGDVGLSIEGHADERGTSEYNLALGEKRASAAKKYLVALGIEGSRLSTISYGEEMPIDDGQSEAAWSKNRRVHFEIQGI